MACSRQAGPQAYLRYIEEMTGHSITQAEWHEMREMAQEDAVRTEFYRLQSHQYDVNGNRLYEDDNLMEQARANVGNVISRERVSAEEADSAVKALIRRVKTADLSGKQRYLATEDVVDAADAMRADAANAHVTKGTVSTVAGIADRGVALSVSEARGRIKQKAQYRAEKAAVTKAAETEPDEVMAAGLEKAASLMTEKGDAGVMKWRLSGDMDREYPGLKDRYAEITRGSVEARKFSMFSRKGNEAALAAARGVQERILEGKVTYGEVSSAMEDAMKTVGAKHPEIWDTEPTVAFFDSVNEAGREMGWRAVEW